MSNLLAPVARQRTLTDLGVVAPGARLSTLVSGTPNTPLATTADAQGTVPNANPIVASAGGLFGPIYLTPNVAYRFVLTTTDGLPIWDQDPVTAPDGSNVSGNLTVGGILTVVGFGAHTISAAGVGSNSLTVRNSQAGPANLGEIAAGNDTLARGLVLQALSSTFASSGAFAASTGIILSQLSAGLNLVTTAAAATVRFYTNSLERVRIAATGELLVNLTGNLFNAKLTVAADLVASVAAAFQNTNPTIGNFIIFYNSASAAAGAIAQTGATSIAYNTTSDARLKDDAGRATDLAALRAVRVHDFTWKADGTRDRGIFAQEAHAVYPRAVSPGTDATTAAGTLARPWMTDYSKFVADLIVGWQQHDAALAALAARLEAGGR